MKKTYISPCSDALTIHSESSLMQASSPSFDVDSNQESDVVLSNSKENSSWNSESWTGVEED